MTSPDPPVVSDSPTAKFEDFDLDEVFQKATSHAENIGSQTFIVEFGPERARIAFDLGSAEIEALLKSKRDVEHYPIRWMYAPPPIPPNACQERRLIDFISRNIWDPSTQRKAVQAIGNHYEFSERLIRLVCLSAQLQPPNSPRRNKRRGLIKPFHRHEDVELGDLGNSPTSAHPSESQSTVHIPKDEINSIADVDDDSMELYLQVKNTVNYFSTDQTPKGAFYSRDS